MLRSKQLSKATCRNRVAKQGALSEALVSRIAASSRAALEEPPTLGRKSK